MSVQRQEGHRHTGLRRKQHRLWMLLDRGSCQRHITHDTTHGDPRKRRLFKQLSASYVFYSLRCVNRRRMGNNHAGLPRLLSTESKNCLFPCAGQSMPAGGTWKLFSIPGCKCICVQTHRPPQACSVLLALKLQLCSQASPSSKETAAPM